VKKILLLSAALIVTVISVAQLKSPEEFLGYKIGSRYTPHHKVVSYFQYVAQAASANVKLQQYGETNEHRPLYLAFVASQENLANLENIRLNNLRLANVAKDKMMPSEAAPAIVWLSYNVHGNETSSSEAAMLTVFALADPANAQSKEWLKNTVVVIDPCLNPDGRERYINWFNSVVGKDFNPTKISREHREPWPGGRSNHYNFDLNRDWSWQTQVESRQRIAQYNQWLPQVHVDFHEQGPNQPYYFAPAAQPYHEVITKWQRDFQESIGKNHAKYFDKNGWLYFTKEIFDLLYPSYGDTYPIYNGSIGMTYEQGGGPAGGLGIDTDEGDTLTLYDRAIHHYTTGMSTVEIASINASELVKQYRKFFNEAASGNIGEYKSYVIKNNPEDAQRLAALMELLDKNGIQYGTTGNGTGRGYSYQQKKEVAFSFATGDLVISSAQSKAALVKVLFEPETKLVDSATYDITAWAMPYVYGLTGYASKLVVSTGTGKVLPDFTDNVPQDAYGYVIRWDGVASAKVMAQLLAKGVKVRYAETGFKANGQSYGNGSLIIVKKANERFGNALWKVVSDVCNANKVKMNMVNTGMVEKGYDFGSYYVHPMTAVRVAMLTGEGTNENAAGEIWNFFDNELKYKLTLINANDVSRIRWSDIDVLILPDGRYKFLNDKDQAEQFRQWIDNGGRVVALENAVSQLSKQDWSLLKSKNEPDSNADAKDKDKDPYEAIRQFDCRERNMLSFSTPGAIFKVDVDNTHPLMFGYPKYYYTLKMDNKVYEFMKDGGWNVGVMRKENQLAGYVGYKLNSKLKDGLLFGVQELGDGTVTYITDNVMFRNFWENGKLMLCNAVFMVGQ
jgi:hypothetical protein